MKSKKFDENSSKNLLKIINSENARKILNATSENFISASQISKNHNIPLTKTYRWLKKLQSVKFIQSLPTFDKDGRKIMTYKSLVKTVIFNPGDSKSKIQILGIGDNLSCNKCGSKKYNLEYNNDTNLWNYECSDCRQKYVETNIQKLKEEQQKIILLEELNTEHALKEEQQKVFLLESLLEES